MMKTWICAVLTLAFLALGLSPTQAAIYHVKKTGSDSNNCTQAQTEGTPKKTIASAFACLGTTAGAGVGHTVRVYTGTYVEFFDRTVPPGTDDTNRFVFEGNSGDTVIIQPVGFHAIWLRNDGVSHHSKYITVKNIILDGTDTTVTRYGIFTDGINNVDGIRLEGVTIRNWGQSGIKIIGSFFFATRNKWHDNGGRCSHAPTNNACHGGYLRTNDSVVEYTEMFGNEGSGAKFYRGGLSADRNIFRYNVSYDNGGSGLQTSGINTLHNNLLYKNGTRGIWDTRGTATIVLNTIVGTLVGFGSTGACIEVLSTKAPTIRDNICWDNAENSIFTTTADVTTNVSDNLFTDPTFTNAAGDDYTLASGSAAINTGIDVGFPSNGLPDKGAFETFLCPTATVNGNIMLITCSMATNEPLQPATVMTGMTVNNGRTVTQAQLKSGTDTIIELTFDGAACLDAETWTYAYSSGNVTDSIDIGRGTGAIGSGLNQPLHTISATTAVKTCGDSPALGHKFVQKDWEFESAREVGGVAVSVIRGGGVGKDIFCIQGCAFAIVTQMDCKDGDCPEVGSDLFYDRNGGTKTLLTDTLGGDGIAWFGPPTANILSGVISCCLSGALTANSGLTQHTQSATPTYDLAQNASVVQRRVIKISKTATVTDKYCFFEFNQSGGILDEATPAKGCVKIIGGQGGGF